MERRSLPAEGVLLGLTAFWGITFVVVKDALGHIDALSFVALRFLIGTLPSKCADCS